MNSTYVDFLLAICLNSNFSPALHGPKLGAHLCVIKCINTKAEAIVIGFCVFVLDRWLLVAVYFVLKTNSMLQLPARLQSLLEYCTSLEGNPAAFTNGTWTSLLFVIAKIGFLSPFLPQVYQSLLSPLFSPTSQLFSQLKKLDTWLP